MPSSETQGQLVGGGKKSKRARKKCRRRKVKNTKKSPWDKVLTDQFQTVGVILACDWCQKTFVFFCPITEQQDLESFLLTPYIHLGQLLAMFYSRRKVPITAQNVGEIVRHIRKKLAANTLDLSQVS